MKNFTIGVFLNLGESFTSLSSQAELMLKANILPYAKAFNRVYVFTYAQETIKLPPNCHLITPPLKLHRYIYTLFLPLIHRSTIRRCSVLRCFQLGGTIPALIAKVLYGSKFVFNHGYDYAAFARLEGKPLQALGFKLLEKIASRLATDIIVKKKNLDINGYYLPNGVDTKLFKPRPKQLSKTPTVLYVGRLEPQKNLTTLLTAVSQLSLPVKLVLVGQGSQQALLKRQAQTLKLNCVFKSQVDHSQLPQLYRTADIFVLPSLIEGSPKVLLEAMATGLPIVAANVPGIKEILTRRTGILVPPTVTGLTQGLTQVLTQSNLARQLGQAARREVAKHYNQDMIIKSEIKFLQSCAR